MSRWQFNVTNWLTNWVTIIIIIVLLLLYGTVRKYFLNFGIEYVHKRLCTRLVCHRGRTWWRWAHKNRFEKYRFKHEREKTADSKLQIQCRISGRMLIIAMLGCMFGHDFSGAYGISRDLLIIRAARAARASRLVHEQTNSSCTKYKIFKTRGQSIVW
jgi:hypothetical protein